MKQLKELKQLLFDDEQRRLDELKEHLCNPQRRAQDIADSLPDSISISRAKGPELTRSLQEPVTECVKKAARENTQFFADALFPVIMPAIRRAITDALRSFVQTLKYTLEQALSPKSLGWRLEALRSGVPYPEVVLRHTLIYRVEQVFLIHRNTGLLIAHISHPDITVKDSDAISAMFTALQDFVHESFDTSSSDALDSIDIGDHTTWLLHGPFAMLACVIRGIPPLKLRQQLNGILEDLERRFGNILEQFDGDKSVLGDIDPILRKCLQLEVIESEHVPILLKHAAMATLVVLLLIALVSSFYWSANRFQEQNRINNLHTALEDSPGLVVIDVSKKNGQRIFKGLRDPLAADPEALANSLGFTAGDVGFSMIPYYSIDPAIVLERANRILKVPEGIQLILNEGVLKAVGTAPSQWLNKTRETVSYIAGIERIDLDDVNTDENNLLHEIIRILKPPEGVKIGVKPGILQIMGIAPHSWITQLPEKLDNITWLSKLEIGQLSASESLQLHGLVKRINGKNIYFLRDIQIRAESLNELRRITSDLVRVKALCEQIGATMKVQLIGYSDGTGGPEINRKIRTRRVSEILKSYFYDTGLDPTMFTVSEIQVAPGTGFDPLQRRVTITVDIVEPDIHSSFTKWLQ
jgi:hypothetical protein